MQPKCFVPAPVLRIGIIFCGHSGFAMALFRQSGAFAKALHARIAANQIELRERELPAHANGAKDGRAIQSFEGPVLVAKAGEHQCFLVGVRP